MTTKPTAIDALKLAALALPLFCGCAHLTPLQDVREDAIRQRAMLSSLVSARHNRELTCEQFENLAAQMQLSWRVDSIAENTYWEKMLP